MGIRTDESMYFTEVFKKSVVAMIENGTITHKEANLKYNIRGHSTILKWCRKYGNGTYSRQVTASKEIVMNKDEYEIIRLKNENRLLKQELEDARMKNTVLDTFVDIAEKELGIPIRKKYGVKQSGR